MYKDRAELAHWQGNQDPKLQELLKPYMIKACGEDNYRAINPTEAATRNDKIGKHTDAARFKLATSKDMISTSYPIGMTEEFVRNVRTPF